MRPNAQSPTVRNTPRLENTLLLFPFMQSPIWLTEEALTVEAVFAAVQDRLPASHEPLVGHTEIGLALAPELKRRLARGEWVIARYRHCWFKAWDRVSPLLVDWTYGWMAACLVLMLVAGVVAAVLGLRHKDELVGFVMFLGSPLVGLALAARFSGIQPPQRDHTVMVIDGRRRELLYACKLLKDEPVDRLVRLPMADVALWFEWDQVGDSSPDRIDLFLGAAAAAAGARSEWPEVHIGKFRHRDPAPFPDDLMRQAQALAQALGVQYLGLIGKPEW